MSLSVLVRNKEQYDVVKKYEVETIYTDNIDLAREFPDMYYAPWKEEKEVSVKKLLIRDLGLLEKYHGTHDIILDYGLNIANLSTIELFLEYGVKKMTLSVELSLEELKFFKNLEFLPIEMLIYGRVIDMTLKRHPIIKENGYELEDVKKRKYPVKVDKNQTVYLYHHEPINRLNDIPKYVSLGIQNFRIDFYEETEREIQHVLESYFQKI